MADKFFFHLHKTIVVFYTYVRNLIGFSWISIEGIRLPIYTEIGYNTYRWILNGQYEQAERIITAKTLESDDVVLEIGTGLGYISTFCCKMNGSNQVFTYEANTLNYKIAQRVFEKNNVSPVSCNELLADATGKVFFSIDKKNRLASSFLKDTGVRIEIKKDSLNEVIGRIKPSYLLMDIEGGESAIFSIIDFQSIRKVQFELHPDLLKDTDVQNIFSVLERNGFMMNSALSFHPHYFFSRSF